MSKFIENFSDEKNMTLLHEKFIQFSFSNLEYDKRPLMYLYSVKILENMNKFYNVDLGALNKITDAVIELKDAIRKDSEAVVAMAEKNIPDKVLEEVVKNFNNISTKIDSITDTFSKNTLNNTEKEYEKSINSVADEYESNTNNSEVKKGFKKSKISLNDGFKSWSLSNIILIIFMVMNMFITGYIIYNNSLHREERVLKSVLEQINTLQTENLKNNQELSDLNEDIAYIKKALAYIIQNK